MQQLTIKQLKDIENLSGQLNIDFNEFEDFIEKKRKQYDGIKNESELFQQTLAKRLRDTRVKCGESRTDVASYVGISASAIGNYENCQSLPEVRNLISIANYLKVSLDWLVGRDEYINVSDEIDRLQLELAERDYLIDQIRELVARYE